MRIEVRVGLWHDGMGVSVTPQVANTLAELWGHLEADAGFVDGRTIFVEGKLGSKTRFSLCTPGRNGDDTHRMRVGGTFSLDAIARCMLVPVFLENSERVPALFLGEMPPCHELPWPKLTAECKSYYGPDEVLRQILLRRRSALRAGERRMPSIPDRFLALLDEDRRRRLLHETQQMQKDMAA